MRSNALQLYQGQFININASLIKTYKRILVLISQFNYSIHLTARISD